MPWKFRICIDGRWLDSETHFDSQGEALSAMAALVTVLAEAGVIAPANVYQLERRGNPR